MKLTNFFFLAIVYWVISFENSFTWKLKYVGRVTSLMSIFYSYLIWCLCLLSLKTESGTELMKQKQDETDWWSARIIQNYTVYNHRYETEHRMKPNEYFLFLLYSDSFQLSFTFSQYRFQICLIRVFSREPVFLQFGSPLGIEKHYHN